LSINKQKIIILDGGVLTHRAIFNWGSVKKKILEGKLSESTFLPPVSYTFFQMIISALKKIGLNENDKVILALDKTNSWRKFFYPEYKAQRAGLRDEHEHINWKYHYSLINQVTEQIEEATNWNIIWLPKLWQGSDLFFTKEGHELIEQSEIEDYNKWYGVEADDIIAYASEYFSDKEVIFVSIDADLDQLCVRENTKFFTLTKKFKGTTGMYKVVNNGYKVLAKKIEKGDVSDNIIPRTTDNGSANAQKRRELIIDLINLPEFVKEELKIVFDTLKEKELSLERLPFQKSLAKKFSQIYEKDNIITYEDCVTLDEKRKKRASNKAKLKREQKKKEALK